MKRQLTWITEPSIEVAILPSRKPSAFLKLAEARVRHRKVRIALPSLPRRHLCVTKQAELAIWQANGGDVLRSDHATQTEP